MNKDLIDQLPSNEQPVASKLNSLAGDMHLSPGFQWELETQLMQRAKTKSQPAQGWLPKLLPVMGWAILAVCAVFLLQWTILSLAPEVSPAARVTSAPEPSFETDLRQGNICRGPLAVGHGFSVFLTNPDKTGFIRLDQEKTIGEMRSFAWSPDGKQLAIVGNTMGRGNIHITNPDGEGIEYLLFSSEVGYLMDAAWSGDGKQFLMWSSQNNKLLYLLNVDGTGLVEKQLDMQILGTPQFTPGGESIVFYGADSVTAGLFEMTVNDLKTQLISAQVEDESGFAWSPDGSRLAYVEMDRDQGKARLVSEIAATGVKTTLTTLPIPHGSGSAVPESANLRWSAEGTLIVFEFGQYETDRGVYLAYADGTGLIKVADSAYAPAISADGRCLAYISDKQVFLVDLTTTFSTATPLLLGDLPGPAGSPDFRLDRLQWGQE
jgi:Tol biopolymer transport system component